jgi:GT2 family glycosyltransferase
MRAEYADDPVDALSIIEGELSGQELPSHEEIPEPEDDEIRGFDEDVYLSVFPDIADAIGFGEWASGRDHYLRYGIDELRLDDLRYRNALRRRQDSPTFPAFGLDAVFLSRRGWCLVIGWLDDQTAPLNELILQSGDRVVAVARHPARCRREDAEAVVAINSGKLLGFWTLFQVEGRLPQGDEFSLSLSTGRQHKTFPVQPKFVGDEQLREIALEYFASARYFSNPQSESVLQLDRGLGQTLVNYNVLISSDIIAGAYVARFGAVRDRLDGSIVICLYGKAEFLFLQAAAFSDCPGSDRYEFIYVSNSPELAEQLMKEATMASRIYDVSITLVLLPSNAGFGAANNVAAAHARSDRIMIVNPDIFPRQPDWALRHSAVIAGLPREQTAIFGVPLYYDDGSLMHSGMFFDIDRGVSVREGRIEQHDIIRVEHYAKGAPPDTRAYLTSRPVPAVTGAFISLDRAWFEELGGFSPEYVFGHYEDADLCLKSLSKGTPVWVHPVPFWHLEGKGSTRRHVHEGGSTVNRWHFTLVWKDFIADELCGRSPKRLGAA